MHVKLHNVITTMDKKKIVVDPHSDDSPLHFLYIHYCTWNTIVLHTGTILNKLALCYNTLHYVFFLIQFNNDSASDNVFLFIQSSVRNLIDFLQLRVTNAVYMYYNVSHRVFNISAQNSLIAMIELFLKTNYL